MKTTDYHWYSLQKYRKPLLTVEIPKYRHVNRPKSCYLALFIVSDVKRGTVSNFLAYIGAFRSLKCTAIGYNLDLL